METKAQVLQRKVNLAEKLVEGLNPSQLKAVETINGMVQICSVAGSGKTTVLTRRLAYMIQVMGINPASIMVTTFTKKATEEMKTRLGTLLTRAELESVTLGTTHSIAYRILKKEYSELHHHLAPALRKDLLMGGQKRYMEDIKKAIMNDRTVAYDLKEELRDIAIPQLVKAIGLSKNEGIDHLDYEVMHSGKNARMDAYIEFYKRYEQRKWNEQVMDGDDLLFNLVRLLQTNREVLQKYRRMYKYIMIDEAQDNNQLQNDIFSLLGAPEYNIFVVGDDDQAMYSFRGARPDLFIHLDANYKGVQRIALEDNYRSNPGILEVANNLIFHNKERISKRLKAHKVDPAKSVNYTHYDDESDEARGIVDEVAILHEKNNLDYKRMAVLYRTNAQSMALESQLIMAGLPYVIHGGVSFYERKEVKDIVAYMRLAVDRNNNEAFKRVYNVPKRYLCKAFFEKVKAVRCSHWDALNRINLARHEKEGVESFTEVVLGLSQMFHVEHATPEDMVDYLLQDGGYEKYLVGEEGDEEDEGNSRLENVSTLKYAMSQFDKLEDFLDYIDMMTSKAKHSIDGVQLMSIHKSKGLEFPVVFVAGACEGLLPHFRAVEAATEKDDEKPIEEERRLMYVAMTRAESMCYVSSMSMANGRPTGRSRFVDEAGLKPETEEDKDAESNREQV